MGKRSRNKTTAPAAPGAVGPREPCPCGSGKRYKACHGDPKGPAPAFVRRPFEGLPGECDLIALRELVPAATARLGLSETARSQAGDAAHEEIRLCTLLPGAAPAMVRADGEIWLALQVQHSFGDPSRDLGAVLEKAPGTEPGNTVVLTTPPGDGNRLQELVTGEELPVSVHKGFEYWAEGLESSPELDAALERANGAIDPTDRLTGVRAAYWTNVGPKEHLRWVMPEPEDDLLTALARLHVSGDDVLVPDARLIGMFRAHGLLAPVWDLPVGTGAEALEDPAEEFKRKLNEALADSSPITAEIRSARAGLANRQVTIR